MSMLDDIVEFEQLNKKCTNLKIDLDALLVLKLLYNANLTEYKKQLALTACPQRKHETMKNVLTTSKIELQTNFEVEIKEEMMITENCGSSRKMFRGFMYRGARYKGCSRTIGRGLKRMNPIFKGVISRCSTCESTHHFGKGLSSCQQKC